MLGAMVVLDYLAKLKRGLGLAFGTHFVHHFSIKMFIFLQITYTYFPHLKITVQAVLVFPLRLRGLCVTRTNKTVIQIIQRIFLPPLSTSKLWKNWRQWPKNLSFSFWNYTLSSGWNLEWKVFGFIVKLY